MIQKRDTTDGHLLGNGYTSCIKIKGTPILPPLVTAERRAELQNYKKKAIDLERRLKCQKDLKLFIEQVDSNHLKVGDKRTLTNNKSRSCNRSLEHVLSFGCDESHIDALNIPDISRKNDQKLPFKGCKSLVPLKEQNQTPNLTCNTFDVTQYSDKGVVLFNEFNKSEARHIIETDRNFSANAVELDLTVLSYAGDAPGAILLQENECRNMNTLNNLPLEMDKQSNTELTLSTETITISSPLSIETYRPKPRLLRSNSYTLESPSPVLLEHLKQTTLDSNSSCVFEKYSGPKKRLSLDLGNSNRCSTSFDGFIYKTYDCEAAKSALENIIPNQSTSDSVNCDIPSAVKLISNIHVNDNNGCDFISIENIGHVVQDLAQKHFGTNTEYGLQSPKEKVPGVPCNATVIVDGKKTDDLSELNSRVVEAEVALQEVLSDMPENYAKEIMELLERHKKEQEVKLKSHTTLKHKLIDQNINLSDLIKCNSSIEISNTINVSTDIPTNFRYLASGNVERERQVLQFDALPPEKPISVRTSGCGQAIKNSPSSPTDTLNALNTSTPLLIDFESDSCDNESVAHFQHNSSYSNSDPLHVLRGYDDYRRLATCSQEHNTSCNRELFPERPDKLQGKLREQWAATILTAAAKGYLVRRLKRTERVKNLIQTIQEALLCAMSLHTQSSETIRPPDVELHRRLIQQVSAACYEFYDVFFTLTIPEQMALIALDRQRIQEKLKRPKSVSSLKIVSGRSTPKSQRHSFNMRQKKSLTPSFAA